MGYVPDTVNKTRDVTSRASQLPDLSGPPVINKETFGDTFAGAEGPVEAQHKWF